MKKISIVAIATIMVVGSLFTSCEAVKNTNQTQRGAAIGAVVVQYLVAFWETILVKVVKGQWELY